MTKHMYEAVISMINYMNMMCIDRVSVHFGTASWGNKQKGKQPQFVSDALKSVEQPKISKTFSFVDIIPNTVGDQ